MEHSEYSTLRLAVSLVRKQVIFVVVSYVVFSCFIGFVGAFIRHPATFICRELDSYPLGRNVIGRNTIYRRVCQSGDFVFAAILCAIFWPLIFIGVSSWLLYHEIRAKAQRKATDQRSAHRPGINISKWRSRGWLILLRARYLSSLAVKPPKDRQRCFSDCRRRKKSHRKPFALTDVVDERSSVAGEKGVELDETFSSEWDFARVVVGVTEVREEGIFRHVVTYL